MILKLIFLAANATSGLMNMFKGGASKLMNNIKETVSHYTKTDLDIDYITPRLAGS